MHIATRPALRRIVAIDCALRAADYPNAVSLAADLETSRRTIQRDLEFMRDSLGAPLAFSRKYNGYYYTDASWPLPYFRLTEGELVALFIAERVLRQYRGTPYEADLTRAFRKITEALPEEITVDLGQLEQTHSFRAGAVTLNDLDTFRRLGAAVLAHRQLRLTYCSPWRDAVTVRTVDPYHLANVDGEWYVVGFCHLREDIRMFSPARIRRLEETGCTFPPPEDFSIARYLDGAFRVVRESDTPDYQVRLRFAPEVAGYVREKVWHSSQVLADEPDGSLELALQVGSLIEVRRWVLSFGPDCEVREPEELRAQIRRDAERMAALYRTAASSPPPRRAPSGRRKNPSRKTGTG